MTTAIATNRQANLTGSIWMVAAMAAFAVEDTLIKTAAQTLPVGEILAVFGLGGALAFACLALRSGQALFVREAASRPMLVRVLFEIVGRLFYALAIALIPLSAATVILQATPLAVVAGAAIFFGEQVGWRRWTAILVGLLGVVVIVQPGTDSFSMLSILAVVGMIGFAGRDLASRAAPLSLGTWVLGFYGFLSVAAAGFMYWAWQGTAYVEPDARTWLFVLGSVFVGVGAYSCLMKAMRTGQVAAVTPFRYTRLLFGMALGVALFGEQVTVAMVLGSALIVSSGVFITWRGRRRAGS